MDCRRRTRWKGHISQTQENDFALLDLDETDARVTRMVARGGRFRDAGTRCFRFEDTGWREAREAVAVDPKTRERLSPAQN